jgi:cytoskeletal protein RodZ
METVGQLLKAGRIQSNKSLEEIAEATKIRRGLLEAIEEDRCELLPPRIYLRGMIKLFAQEVGVDIDAVLDTFESASPDKSGGEEKKDVKRQLQTASPRTYMPLLLIIVVAFLVYFFLINKSAIQDESSLEIEPVQQDVTTAPATAPVTTTSAAAALPTPPAEKIPAAAPSPVSIPKPELPLPAGPFTIRFEAQALTWIRIQVDQEQRFDILLRPGESYKHTATRTMTVRLGNAGGVTIYCNDTLLGTAGKSGEVMNLRFPEAIQQLQQPR